MGMILSSSGFRAGVREKAPFRCGRTLRGRKHVGVLGVRGAEVQEVGKMWRLKCNGEKY